MYNVRFLLQFIAPFLLTVFVAISARAAWRQPGLGTVCYALGWGFFLSEATLLMLRLMALVPFTAPLVTFSQSAVASLLFGVAIFFTSIAMLLAPAVFFAVIDRMVIPREEETMERLFGQDYLAYKDRVRRWI